MSMTNETKHTPGPWTTWNDGIKAPNGEIVCTVHALDADHSKIYGNGQSDHNADLIARAPTLLAENETLRQQNAELVRALSELVAERDNDFHHDTEGFNMARAILATVQA